MKLDNKTQKELKSLIESINIILNEATKTTLGKFLEWYLDGDWGKMDLESHFLIKSDDFIMFIPDLGLMDIEGSELNTIQSSNLENFIIDNDKTPIKVTSKKSKNGFIIRIEFLDGTDSTITINSEVDVWESFE